MKILYLSSEVAPFAKTGGLADVAGALPVALQQRGHEVAVMMPRYGGLSQGKYQIAPTGVEFAIPIGGQSMICKIEKTFLPESRVPLFLTACPPYFDRDGLYQTGGKDYPDNLERFVFFCRAVLQAVELLKFKPDIIHVNDWQTALVPVYLKEELAAKAFFQDCKTLLTIHNLAYQGNFPRDRYDLTSLDWRLFTMEGLEFYGSFNLLKGGLLFSDRLTTVSQHYSEEIQTEEYGCGLDGVLRARRSALSGILNGVDYSIWNPETDRLIARNYNSTCLTGKKVCKEALQKIYGLPPRPDVPLLGIISRLADQKGFDLLTEVFDYLMAFDVQFVLLGTGDPEYHRVFEALAKRYPEQCGVKLRFDNALAHQIEAGADLFLMPSQYEPCGMNQMYSLKYGTIPVVRATGGLADTVQEYDPKTGQGNGFRFEDMNPKQFFWAVKRAMDLFRNKDVWTGLMCRAMQQDFSWNRSAGRYEALYKTLKSGTLRAETQETE